MDWTVLGNLLVCFAILFFAHFLICATHLSKVKLMWTYHILILSKTFLGLGASGNTTGVPGVREVGFLEWFDVAEVNA